MNPSRHVSKSVLVTGAASGIGRGIVERFLAEGARVVGFDLRPTDILNDRFLSVTGDATKEADVDRAVGEAVARHGGLDVMVCNAGVIAVQPVTEMPLEEWRRVMGVNVDSVFLGARASARAMIRQGKGGVIITAASGAGRRGVPNLSHYCASKAAIIVFTQALAIELAPHRIRANAYAPGHIETPFWGGIAEGFAQVWGKTPEEVIEGFRATVPWGRFGTPDDVAAAVSWLASEEAEYVSGQTLAMNGAEFPT
jgi:NAD(P)-dependent dehydrogenase (short-subunit alcohol dehydrogenase family)